MGIKRQGMKRGISLLPNLLTTANLFCGFLSITMTLRTRYEFAAWLVVLAGVFDFLDGRVARMTNTQSDFGVEYDSLSDLTTFCMAPAILIFHWSLMDYGKFGVAACFLYFACGALRLARFNVQSGSVEKVDFQGLPTPSAGGTLVSYVIFYQSVFGEGRNPSLIVLFMAVGLALLMVSNVKYKSAKRVKRGSFFFMVCAVGVVFVVAAQPDIMLFAIGVIYVGMGLVQWLWQSPDKIRSTGALIRRIYNERNEQMIYEDDEDDDSDDSSGKVIKI